MNSVSDVLKEAIIRIIVIAGIVIAFSLIVFGSAAFNPFATSFEFAVNGVTIAIAYAAFKSNQIRNGFAALLIWYIFVMVIVPLPYDALNLVMVILHIIGLTAAVYLYFLAINKHLSTVGFNASSLRH